jgi:hypothetical protein
MFGRHYDVNLYPAGSKNPSDHIYSIRFVNAMPSPKDHRSHTKNPNMPNITNVSKASCMPNERRIHPVRAAHPDLADKDGNVPKYIGGSYNQNDTVKSVPRVTSGQSNEYLVRIHVVMPRNH